MTLGRVVGVFGIKGWIRVQSHTRPADNLFDYAPWTIRGEVRQIEEAQGHGGGYIVKLAGLDDRGGAAQLTGADIEVARSALPEPEEGQVYWADLVGCEVVCEDGRPLGAVETLVDNGAQDVLVIRGEHKRHLVPFVRGPIVKSIELAQRRIVVEWSPDY